jgi:hypothetical protein
MTRGDATTLGGVGLGDAKPGRLVWLSRAQALGEPVGAAFVQSGVVR